MKTRMLDKYLKLAYEYRNKIQIAFVCNVDGLTKGEDDYSSNSITSEYLTLNQYNKILSVLRQEGFDVKAYFDEGTFMSDVITSKCKNTESKRILVLNSAQKGTKIGRKSLIPAFCDFYQFFYNNSNPYIVSLCRDKYISGVVLEYMGLPQPRSWLYCLNSGWLLNKEPPNGIPLIAKLNYETSSIGLDKNNIFIYDESKNHFLEKMSQKYMQDIIVQEFISGYEIESSFIRENETFVFPPVGISMDGNELLDNKILDYTVRKTHPYSFYNYLEKQPNTAAEIQNCTKQAAAVLNITGLGRIDYRVTSQYQYYITDVATNPGYGDFSSTYFIFKCLGYSYSEMIAISIGVTIGKNF